MNNEKKFYVYALYDLDEEFPFYIGKGTGNRAKYSATISGSLKNDIKNRKRIH